MYRTKAEPVPPPWPLVSFRYYDHTCKIMNVGGHKDSDKLRHEYRHDCIKALADKWHVYMGTWHVSIDNKVMLVTPSKKEALQRWESFKLRCIYLHEGNKGSNAVEAIVDYLKNKPVNLEK